MFATVLGATPRGVGALFVTVEVDRLHAGLPGVVVVGMPDTAVREARERILAAVRHLGFPQDTANIVINLSPADERKEGASLDLPMALAFLAAAGKLPPESVAGRLAVGELSLDGRLLPVRGILPMVLAARRRGLESVILPEANADEAAVVDGVEALPAGTLGQVLRHLRGEERLQPARPAPRTGAVPGTDGPDLSEVVGQEVARRALEIAAAGGHHLLFMGPPGAGKSMLARRLPGILPPLDREESLETTSVYSVSTRVPRPNGLLDARPFRAPHHTISAAALVGGGTSPQPGEISLAHNGVLFLDELMEFRRDVLEALRQPLEDGTVTVARSRMALTFPARFQLVAAANPCPCGHLGDSNRPCTCTPNAIHRYRSRLSGPLLDRLDLQVMVPAVPWRDLSDSRRGESSPVVAARVAAARSIQTRRFEAAPGISCNAGMGPRAIDRWARPGRDGHRLLERATAALGLSARAYHRILRVARTIADLDGSEPVGARHVAEAIAYRALDCEELPGRTAAAG